MSEDYFERQIIEGPRRSARIAWGVAGAAVAVSLVQGIAIMAMMPLKTTEVFTVLVDKTTGQSERIMQVEPVGISEEQAVKEALLVGYINDRESLIMAGLQERLESVVRRSDDYAREAFIELWTESEDNEIYPPNLYGKNSEITVRIRAISFLTENVAQVRFLKTLRQPQGKTLEGSFIATVDFSFDPRRERNMESVWENPLGFTVTSYTVDSETLGGMQ